MRQATGVSRERFQQLVHVMSKVLPACKGLASQHIYCSVVGGTQVRTCICRARATHKAEGNALSPAQQVMLT